MAESVATDRDAGGGIADFRANSLLGLAPERDFDEIVEFAAELCEAPVSLISLVGRERQWFKAAHGTDLSGTPIDHSICAHAMSERTFLEIPDTSCDARTSRNPLCQGPEAIRFYGGAILRFDDGVPIGTLCVLDRRPRRLTAAQKKTMVLLARQVVRQIELREALAVQDRLRAEIDHRVKNSLQMVASYLRLQQRGAETAVREVLQQAERQVGSIVALHAALNEANSADGVELSGYLARIAELLRRTLPPNIALDYDVAPVRLDASSAAGAALIVNEFVANSVKHAFPDRDRGNVRLEGQLAGPRYKIRLEDDGVGFGETASAGSGLMIIDAVASQLGATVERPGTAAGALLSLSFPVGSQASVVAGGRAAS